MPTSLTLPALDLSWDLVLRTTIGVGGALLAALVVHYLLFLALRRIARLSPSVVDDAVIDGIRGPMRWAILGLAISIGAQTDAIPGDGWDVFVRFLSPALLGWVAYTLVKGLTAGFDAEFARAEDAVAQRSRRTRVAILSRTASFVIAVVTVSLIMLNIPGVRDVGTTLLASAGLAALAVGAAAQPALKSLIAGLQMALTQPLRLGDLVKVDGQAGRVEEIRMSFVTVRTWDERVLVVPTSRFLDQSFENWSRISERLTGPVMLHLDPAAEIGPIRAEFERFVQAHTLWDGRNLELLMTEALPGSVELRLAMSADSIGDLFTLRCAVREHMLGWIRANQPDALIHRVYEADAAPAKT